MTALSLQSQGAGRVVIDACEACHVFWFDQFESVKLTPASTLQLFELIGRHSTGSKVKLADAIRCPRCSSRLVPTHDRQRGTRFEYLRCDQRHGRLITFFHFLREKDFIRPLTPQQLAELRHNLHTVNCSNCGGPVDLAHGSACAHCGSPISMLDMKQAERLVSQLQDAAAPKPVDPDLALQMERAKRQVEASFAAMERGDRWWHDASSFGLVEAGLGAVINFLGRRIR